MKGDLGNLFKQAQKMQEDIQKAQETLATRTVEGVSGAGLVSITINGKHEVQRTKIDESLKAEPTEVIEDLITAAINDANRKIEGISKGHMSSLMAGVSLPDNLKDLLG